MRASVGDHIVIKGHQVGSADREGEILETRGTDGAPPYVVRWTDGREDLMFPSSDAVIVRSAATSGW